MDEIQERVAAGAALLDEVEPEWWRKIDLRRLDISSGCRCVAAQLVDRFEGEYNNAWEYAMFAWGIVTPLSEEGFEVADSARAKELGFLGHNGRDEQALDEEWRVLIEARRAA